MRKLFVLYLALACTTQDAWAKKPYRAAALVLAGSGEDAEALAGKAQGYMQLVLTKTTSYKAIDVSKLLGGATPKEFIGKIERANQAATDGEKLLRNGSFEEAEAKLNTARQGYEEAIAFVEPEEWAELLAYLGTSKSMQGDLSRAQIIFQELSTFDPQFKFEEFKLPAAAATAFKKARATTLMSSRGTLSVQSAPNGAKIFVDGLLKGYTPMKVENLAEGAHLVQVDRPGYLTTGQMVEIVGNKETSAVMPLTSIRGFERLNMLLKRVVAEARGEISDATRELGQKLELDRALIGVVNKRGDLHQLDLFAIDLKLHKLLAKRSETLEKDEFSDIESGVKRLAMALLDDTEQTVDANSTDPLEHKSGTEDWNSHKKQQKRDEDDPLDAVKGTEDW